MSQPVFSGANHICIVTADIDRAVRTWADRYGVGPWQLWTKDSSNMSSRVDGEVASFAMRVALCQLSASFRIELIQPLDDRSPYAASLGAHGGADHIHHVRFDVEDYERSTELLDGLGVRRIFEGRFAGASADVGEFVGSYHDTVADLGFIAEVGAAPPRFAMPEPEEVYPPGSD
jgi:methylmalonyl-CoA/ethylmalonyl-CoA epimerase